MITGYVYSENFDTQTIIRPIETMSSFNLLGAGARPQGMGWTYIALSDDQTGVVWNPSGPTILEHSEFAITGFVNHRIEKPSFKNEQFFIDDQTVSYMDLKYIGFLQPVSILGYDGYLSVYYHNQLDFNRKWNFIKTYQEEKTNYQSNIDYQSEGVLSSLGIASGIRLAKNVSIGLSLDIMDDKLTKNHWEQNNIQKSWGQITNQISKNSFEEYYHVNDRFTFKGIQLNTGLVWRNINQLNLSLGLVCKTAYSADITQHRHIFISSTAYQQYTKKELTSHMTLKMPLSYGLGLCYRFSDYWLTAVDIYRTKWNQFRLIDASGNEISPLTGLAIHDSEIRSATQVRIGTEYTGFQTDKYIVPLCFGVFYDPMPSEESPDDYWGMTFGTGFVMKNLYSLDIAYQYRFGHNVNQFILKNEQFSQDVHEHSVNLSLIIFFDK